jgi:hypothetical protein
MYLIVNHFITILLNKFTYKNNILHNNITGSFLLEAKATVDAPA